MTNARTSANGYGKWLVVGLLFLATLLNYLANDGDEQNRQPI